jgi:hypothetical protein
MRRHNWKNVLVQQDGNVTQEFKDQILKEYEVKIKRKVNFCKSKDIERMALRADFESHKFNSGIYDTGVIAAKRLTETKNHKKISVKSFNIDGVLPASMDAQNSDDSANSIKITSETESLMTSEGKLIRKLIRRFGIVQDDKIQKLVELEEAKESVI